MNIVECSGRAARQSEELTDSDKEKVAASLVELLADDYETTGRILFVNTLTNLWGADETAVPAYFNKE